MFKVPVTPIIQRADPKWANSYLDDGAYERVLEREKKRDKDLNIQRDTIPTQVIVFPNTPHSLQCQEIVEQIDRQLDVLLCPEKQAMALMLRCIQNKWQIRALWLASELCDRPLPDLVERCLPGLVPPQTFDHLSLEVPYDIALHHLVHAGEREIQTWCQQHRIAYPFATPFDLFLKILEEEFINSIERCFSLIPFQANLRARQDDHRQWVAFLSDRFWDDEEQNNQTKAHKEIRQEFIAALRKSGWTGYAILALWETKGLSHLTSAWSNYLRAYRRLQPLIEDEMLYQQHSPTLAGNTSHRTPLYGAVTSDGYFYYHP